MSSQFIVLNPMQVSPLDAPGHCGELPADSARSETARHWVPSRFNARTSTRDGGMILWNTYTGSINFFNPPERPKIAALLRKRGFISKLEGSVKYLHDRGYIVAEGTNEYRRVQLAFGQRHYREDRLELILLASEDCNFRCVYCYEDFRRGTMQPTVRNRVRELVEKRAEDLKELRISWFGGEPLYGFDAIADLGPFFVDVADRYGLALGCHMTTNGYLLTPDVADQLLSWQIRDFQITLDGTPEQHDCRRKGRDGGGTFNKIFANLKAMHHRTDHFGITIRVNYDLNSYLEMEPFLKLLESELGGDDRFSLSFQAIGTWGGPNDNDLAVCGFKEARRANSTLKKSAMEKGFGIDTLGSGANVGAHVCYAGRPFNYLIGADGKVMKCTVVLDKEDYNVVGKIVDGGELELDTDKMALWVEPAFANDRKCQRCHILPVCQGMHCPLIRIEENRQPCPSYKSDLKTELNNVLMAAGRHRSGAGVVRMAD
jgi:uncharacterized protein